MASHINFALGLSRDNLLVIPNGVDPRKFSEPFDREALRKHYASPSERLILYVGRMVHEKGVNTLLDAAHIVLRSVDSRFVFVGEGYLKDTLMKRAWDEGIATKVCFPGFLDDPTVKLLYRAADVCVVPSLYEPFGIVALEAMAAGTPVVVSNVGGLAEIVQHDWTGVTVYPNSPDSIAWGILRVLTDKAYASKLAMRASEKVLDVYNWNAIARRTSDFYEGVLSEYLAGSWKPLRKESE